MDDLDEELKEYLSAEGQERLSEEAARLARESFAARQLEKLSGTSAENKTKSDASGLELGGASQTVQGTSGSTRATRATRSSRNTAAAKPTTEPYYITMSALNCGPARAAEIALGLACGRGFPRARNRRSGGGGGRGRGRRGRNARATAATPTCTVDLTGSPPLPTSTTSVSVINLDSDNENDEPLPASTSFNDSFDFDLENPVMSVKVKWNEADIFKYPIRKHQKLTSVFEDLAKMAGVAVPHVVLTLNYGRVHPDDTPAKIEYKIFEFITGRVMMDIGPPTPAPKRKIEANEIVVKVQCPKWKQPKRIAIKKDEDFKILYIKCAEELELPLEKISMKFDGEQLEIFETPTTLELTGGEIIDLYIKN